MEEKITLLPLTLVSIGALPLASGKKQTISGSGEDVMCLGKLPPECISSEEFSLLRRQRR